LKGKIILPTGDALAALARPLVFTNGVFDILHRGHVTYLAAARSLGAGLVVGLNSDSSVRMLDKGSGRPVNRAEDRAIILAALESVTAVIVFEERTPLNLLDLVRPEIYVKGGDYEISQLPEAERVREWGGRAVILPFVDGFSTTRILKLARGD
jgi:rfaE bifunctional protein nucleotidyltransferase chain/domain